MLIRLHFSEPRTTIIFQSVTKINIKIFSIYLKTFLLIVEFFFFSIEYKSPQYEKLAFNLLKNRLITLGYPQEIKDFEYDPSFPIRWDYPLVIVYCIIMFLRIQNYLFVFEGFQGLENI